MPVHCRKARRPRTILIGTTGLAVLVVAIELLGSGIPGVVGGVAPGTHLGFATHARGAAPDAAAEVQYAEGSLASGGGPAAGGIWSCSTPAVPTSGVRCGPSSTPAAPRALVATLPSWTDRSIQTPDDQCCGTMVYDAADGYDLLFGGYVDHFGGSVNQTWKYAGGVWTLLHPASTPPSRDFGAMTYDAADRYVLMYGGYDFSKVPNKYYNDTWSYAAGKWTQLHPLTNPGVAVAPAIAYDVNDSYVVLFGGVNAKGNYTGLTWTFKAGAWTRLTVSPAPSPRGYTQTAYDAADGWVLLFGGGNRTKAFGDTWAFSGGKWRHLTPTTAPGPREVGAMAYSPLDHAAILFGGSDVAPGNLNYTDTWSFAGGKWTRVTSAFSPSSRVQIQIADGNATTPLVLFGGSHYPFGFDLNDTWTYHASTWTRVVPHVPAARGEAVMTYDEADQYVLLFGGASTSGVLGDTWTFVHGAWRNLHPAVSPPASSYESMAYDQGDGYVVLFGGAAGLSGQRDQTWTFLAGVWTALPTQVGGPPGRWQASMAYDALDGYLLLFGGYNVTLGYLDDTWSFAGGAWTNESGGAAPSPRSIVAMTYDSGDGDVLLFGGYFYASGTAHEYSDTWGYTGGSWTNLTPTVKGSPPGLYGAAAAWDATDGYVVLFGGAFANGSASSETWSFANGTWTVLHPATHPVGLIVPTIAYDARDAYVVLFGGITPPTTAHRSTWTY